MTGKCAGSGCQDTHGPCLYHNIHLCSVSTAHLALESYGAPRMCWQPAIADVPRLFSLLYVYDSLRARNVIQVRISSHPLFDEKTPSDSVHFAVTS